MHEKCGDCGLPFVRPPGFYLGSIYVNYGVTTLLVLAGYFAMFFFADTTDRQRLAILGAVCVLFPLWFFRYARSLWRGMDYYYDPAEK